MTEEKPSIFLVDDDKFLLDMYVTKFKASGYTITTASGSHDALNKLREGINPEVLILDIIMPVMDGLELLETIRKEKLAKDATIIMLSNESNPMKIERAKSLGIAGYIVKATSIPSEVVEEVTLIVNKRKKA